MHRKGFGHTSLDVINEGVLQSIISIHHQSSVICHGLVRDQWSSLPNINYGQLCPYHVQLLKGSYPYLTHIANSCSITHQLLHNSHDHRSSYITIINPAVIMHT
eukprot:8736316-Karenia_brevis.AAC.1